MSGGTVFNEEFMIPNNLVGLVIGRGGEQIKKLQSESQCKIRIASDDTENDGTPQRSCTLTGSQEQIDFAKQLLEDVVRRSQNREQGGQGGGQRGGYQQRGDYQGGQRGGYGGGQRGGYGGQQGGYGGGQPGGYGGQQQGGYGGQQGGY